MHISEPFLYALEASTNSVVQYAKAGRSKAVYSQWRADATGTPHQVVDAWAVDQCTSERGTPTSGLARPRVTT
jgi:hypothetical protein